MKQIKSKPLTEKIKDLIISFWRGDLSLAVSYWFFYNLGPTLVIILIPDIFISYNFVPVPNISINIKIDNNTTIECILIILQMDAQIRNP
jgi:hypothetical protein